MLGYTVISEDRLNDLQYIVNSQDNEIFSLEEIIEDQKDTIEAYRELCDFYYKKICELEEELDCVLDDDGFVEVEVFELSDLDKPKKVDKRLEKKNKKTIKRKPIEG